MASIELFNWRIENHRSTLIALQKFIVLLHLQTLIIELQYHQPKLLIETFKNLRIHK